MDNKKIGLFIATLRKNKNMTQKDLADKLYVSDKAVSKWERGLSMPDIGLIEKLADFLDVNVSEILKGEKIEDMTKKDSDEIVKESIPFFQRDYFNKKIIKITLGITITLLLGYFIILSIGEATYGSLSWKLFDGQYSIDLPSYSAKKDRKKAERFLEALQNYDYNTIKKILKPNDISMNTQVLMKEQVSMDDYIANLEELKQQGFLITGYKFRRSYFQDPGYICEFDIKFVINNFERTITAQIQSYGKGVLVDGSSIGSDIGKIFKY